MAVRGAPAIAIAAALGLTVGLINGGSGMQFDSAQAACDDICSKAAYLVTRSACDSRTVFSACMLAGTHAGCPARGLMSIQVDS